MVGGSDYSQVPFNLATQGQRQPGSAFKPFVLATALRRGISPGSTWSSKRIVFDVPNSIEKFTVNNYDDNYSGVSTLARATTFSDNSVFAQVGIKTGTKRIARQAERMGIRTPVSSNYAITLGGLKHGVTALDLAHAYETLATGGLLVTGSLGAGKRGPVGIRKVSMRDSGRVHEAQQAHQAARAARERREHDDEHPRVGHQRRHGQGRADRRRAGVGQDRDDRELRRRLVRRRDGQADGRRVGRLPRLAAADDDRVPRRPGGGRHVPRADLARLHGRRDRGRQEAPGARVRRRPARSSRTPRRRRGGPAAAAAGELRAGRGWRPIPTRRRHRRSATAPTSTTPADPEAPAADGDAPRHGRRATRRRRRAPAEAPAEPPAQAPAPPVQAPPAAPDDGGATESGGAAPQPAEP